MNTKTQNTVTETLILHIDHRKVEVEMRDTANGGKLIIARRDVGASEMWESKKNPLGAFIRQQWNKTFIYKKCAAWAALTPAQVSMVAEITA
jgi:hypothetical protein